MGFLPGRKPPGGGRDDLAPGQGGQAFFAGLGADNAAFRDTMARFHADFAEHSQAQVGIAGQQINEFGYQSLSYSRAAAEAAADAAQARQKAQDAAERAQAVQRHKANARKHLQEAQLREDGARLLDAEAARSKSLALVSPNLHANAQRDQRAAASMRRQAEEHRALARQERENAEKAKADVPAGLDPLGWTR